MNPTYDQLCSDVIQLQESMNILHELVHEQQVPVDSLEEFIVLSRQDVITGEKELVESTSYWYSTMGILLATVVFLLR